MSDALLRYRPEFPILARTNYMISNSSAPCLAVSTTRSTPIADTWATRGVRAWEERWWMLALESRQPNWRFD